MLLFLLFWLICDLVLIKKSIGLLKKQVNQQMVKKDFNLNWTKCDNFICSKFRHWYLNAEIFPTSSASATYLLSRLGSALNSLSMLSQYVYYIDFSQSEYWESLCSDLSYMRSILHNSKARYVQWIVGLICLFGNQTNQLKMCITSRTYIGPTFLSKVFLHYRKLHNA